jgi:hypothetical protein
MLWTFTKFCENISIRFIEGAKIAVTLLEDLSDSVRSSRA